MAEGVGFEPTRPCGLPVFKTGALDQLCDPSNEFILLVTEGYRYAPPLSHARCKQLRMTSLRRTLAIASQDVELGFKSQHGKRTERPRFVFHGGEGGIRTLAGAYGPPNDLANRPLQPTWVPLRKVTPNKTALLGFVRGPRTAVIISDDLHLP